MQKKGERKQRVGKLSDQAGEARGKNRVFDFYEASEIPARQQYLLIVDVGSKGNCVGSHVNSGGIGVGASNHEQSESLRGRVWQSDNAQEFVAKVMKELAALMGAKFKHSSPYHSQTNTRVKRYNKTIATHLSLLVEREDQRDWNEHLRCGVCKLSGCTSSVRQDFAEFSEWRLGCDGSLGQSDAICQGKITAS